MGGFNLLITITNEANKKLSTTQTSKNVSVLTSTSKCTLKKYTLQSDIQMVRDGRPTD